MNPILTAGKPSSELSGLEAQVILFEELPNAA
jgi:hypothetical protein